MDIAKQYLEKAEEAEAKAKKYTKKAENIRMRLEEMEANEQEIPEPWFRNSYDKTFFELKEGVWTEDQIKHPKGEYEFTFRDYRCLIRRNSSWVYTAYVLFTDEQWEQLKLRDNKPHEYQLEKYFKRPITWICSGDEESFPFPDYTIAGTDFAMGNDITPARKGCGLINSTYKTFDYVHEYLEGVVNRIIAKKK